MKVRNRVLKVRSKMRYSQRALAREAGISPFTLRRIEQEEDHETTMTVVRKISETLRRTDLFWLELEPKDQEEEDDD